jgi:F-type H+-transporting ATPase subunit delta
MPQAVSLRFAQALADAVLAPTSSVTGPQAAQELRSFEALVKASHEFRTILLSPAVPTAKKRAVIARFADSLPLSRLVKNFLFIIVDRRRADLLGEMATAFETALDERFGFVRGEVTSAARLSPAQQGEIQQALSAVSGKNVRCAFSVDPELIGGIVARIGSKVYDGSVRTQLQSLGQRLVS